MCFLFTSICKWFSLYKHTIMIAAVVGIITGVIAGLIVYFILHSSQKREQVQLHIEAMSQIVEVPSPFENGVKYFVEKNEFEFGKIIEQADSAIQKKDYDIAEKWYNIALEFAINSKKDKLIGLSLWGISYIKGIRDDKKGELNTLSQALKHIKKTKDENLLSVGYFVLGLCMADIGKFHKAVKNYSKAINLNNSIILEKVYNSRGVAYYETGAYDKALVDLNNAIKLNPQYIEAIVQRGIVYRRK